MKVNAAQSIHHEDPQARKEFSRSELTHLRVLLRRLRFLETQVRKNGGINAPITQGGGAMHAEIEALALEFALSELGYLKEKE